MFFVTIPGVKWYLLPEYAILRKVWLGEIDRHHVIPARLLQPTQLRLVDGNEVGKPRYYAIWGSSICVYPVPDKEYGLRIVCE